MSNGKRATWATFDKLVTVVHLSETLQHYAGVAGRAIRANNRMEAWDALNKTAEIVERLKQATDKGLDD